MVKTIQFLGAIALFGGPFFALVIWRQALRTLGVSGPLPEESPLTYLRVVATLGALGLLLFGALDLIRFTRVAANEPIASAGWQVLSQVAFGTRYGRMLLLRAGIALTALAVLAIDDESWSVRDLLLALLGGGALISFSLASHAAATPVHGAWPLMADMAHILAVGAWVGGLIPLALAPWRSLVASEQGRRLLRIVTARFSVLGLGAVLILAGTGIYMSSLRIYGPQALTETGYGLALLVKLILMAVLITIAAANRFILMPDLGVPGHRSVKAVGWLAGLIRLEVGLAVVAVSFAADLTILSPAEQPPIRVTIAMTEMGLRPAEITLPLGRTVMLALDNQTNQPVSLVIRDFEHRLTRGPGAFRHREMLTFAPPTDRFGLHSAPGKRVTAELTPLAEGKFTIEGRTMGDETEVQSGQVTVQGR